MEPRRAPARLFQGGGRADSRQGPSRELLVAAPSPDLGLDVRCRQTAGAGAVGGGGGGSGGEPLGSLHFCY